MEGRKQISLIWDFGVVTTVKIRVVWLLVVGWAGSDVSEETTEGTEQEWEVKGINTAENKLIKERM